MQNTGNKEVRQMQEAAAFLLHVLDYDGGGDIISVGGVDRRGKGEGWGWGHGEFRFGFGILANIRKVAGSMKESTGTFEGKSGLTAQIKAKRRTPCFPFFGKSSEEESWERGLQKGEKLR